MTHLTPGEVVDAVEDALALDRAEHLGSCAVCRASVDELAQLLRHARHVTVPEPSPLFWDHFSTRVRAAIDSERSPLVVGPAPWLRWSVLVPFGALALLVATLTLTIPRGFDAATHTPAAVAAPEVDDPLALDDDAPWAFVSDIVGQVSLEEAQHAGLIVGPGAAERAAADLTAAEREELMRLLTAALARPES